MAWAKSKSNATVQPMGTGGMTNKQRAKYEEKLDKRHEDHEEKKAIKEGEFDGKKKVRSW